MCVVDKYRNLVDMKTVAIILTVFVEFSFNFQINNLNSDPERVIKSDWFQFDTYDKITYSTSSVNFQNYNELFQNNNLHAFYNFTGSNLANFESNRINYDYYIIIDRDLSDLNLTIFSLLKLDNLNVHGRYIIIMENLLHPEYIALIFDVLFREMDIYNVIVMNNKKFFTWHPYDEHCNTNITIHEVHPKDLRKTFDNKLLKNLNNCTLRVSWTPFEGLSTPNDPFHPGSYAIIMNEIAYCINASISYIYDESLDVTIAYNKYGHIGFLEYDMRRLNVILCLYNFVLNDFRKYSTFIENDQFRALILPPRKLVPKCTEFKVYSNQMILFITVTLLISSYIFSLMTKQSISESLFRVYQLSLQLSLTILPKQWKLRIYFMFLMFFVMVISAAYLSVLSGVFTRPSLAPKIKTLQEFFDSEIPLRINTRTLEVMKSEVVERKKQPWKKEKFIIDSNFQQNVDLFSIYVMQEGCAVYSSVVPSQEKLYRPMEILYYGGQYPRGFLYRYRLHLNDLIDYQIHRFDEAGLKHYYLGYNSRGVLDLKEHEMITVLTITDLSGVFTVWLWGLAIGTVAFTWEIVEYKRVKKLQRL